MSSSGTEKRGFLALPTSSVGRWCGGLLVGSVIAVILNSAVIMPFTERRTAFETIQAFVNGAIGLGILAAGVAGVWAVVRKRDRSWVLFLAIVLTAVVLAFNFMD